MTLLDTNVISELMKGKPSSSVRNWLSSMQVNTLGVTSLSLAEIRWGLCRLPKGQRRHRLETSFERVVSEGFGGRVFGFDEAAATVFGALAAGREDSGLHVDMVDAMIAAIARSIGASVATRNVGDFEGCGIEVVNPWEG